MGTNFYRKPILTKERKEIMHKLVDEGKFTAAWDAEPEESLQGMLEYMNEGIHICKRSSGWYISFDHNWGEYYQPNRKSIEEFLNEPGYEIVDEYGGKYTPEEFWKEVDDWNNNPSLWDAAKYDAYEKSRDADYTPYLCYSDIDRCISEFGIHTTSNDFNVDGLTWSVFSNFS